MTGTIKSTIILTIVSISGAGYSQTPEAAPQPPIVNHITEANRNVIKTTPEILNLLNSSASGENIDERRRSSMRTVYRVQVFSDNHGERSRSEGERKRFAVQRRFPDYPVALGWDSPYWKVKVGIFSSHAEAAEAAAAIKKAFPAYAREIHVIRDRVKISNQ